MSQFPPANVPPPGAPYGYPPGAMQPPQRRANGAAIASLICGILGCVPIITSLVAVILGIVGIKKANDPQVNGGKAMAIIGLLLGLLGLAGWGLFGGSIAAVLSGTSAQREVARQFVKDLAAGNIDAAQANADTSSITREELVAISQKMKGWGTLTDTTLVGVPAQPGKTTVTG